MSRDLRRYALQTNLRLFLGFILLLFLVGDALIWFIYGCDAAMLGLLCLAAGLFPLLFIGLILWVMDWIVKRTNA